MAIVWGGSSAFEVAEDSTVLVSESFAPDGWNSGGFVRGVACTLVMSFAREK